MTTTIRRPTPVDQQTAAPPPAHDDSVRAADPTALATAALTLLSVVVAVGFGRLFADGSFIPSTVATAIGCHAVAWAARRWGLATPIGLAAGLAVPLLVIAWLVLPETTFYGIPTGETLSTALDELSNAYAAFRNVVAPTAVTDGFLIAAVLGVAIAALLADAAAFVVRATFEAAIPSFTLFVFTATLGTASYRSLSVGAFLGALLLFLMLHQESLESLSSSWFASRSRGGRSGLLRAGALLGAIAVAAAVIAGPHLPGAGAKAVVRWRGDEGEGRSTRTTVSPLVNIKTRLVERANVEVFAVTSSERAYWRLTSLDRFDGEIWSSEGSYRKLGGNLNNDAPTPGGTSVVQEFSIAQLGSIWLPGAYEARRVSGVDDLSYNPDSGSIISPEAASDGLVYQVQSVVPSFTADQLAGALPGRPAGRAGARYGAVPDVSPRVRALAQQVAGRGGPYERAMALQTFFRGPPFVYDLNVPPGHSGSALDRFLFQTKRGYCEQFAGSFAVLARLVGLPARVAVGFTAGELGSDGRYHVRDLNAHAWPEVYLDGFGWVAFEPTPGRGMPGAEDYTGVPESQANPNNLSTATTLGVTPTTTSPAPNNETPTPSSVPAEPPPAALDEGGGGIPKILVAAIAIVAVAGLAIGGVLAAKRVRRTRRRAAATDVADRVLVAWAEASEALGATRVSRRRAETMAEYAGRASAEVPLADAPATAFNVLAADASAASYGAAAPDDASIDRAEAAVSTVHSAIRATVSAPRRLLWAIDPRPLFSRRRA